MITSERSGGIRVLTLHGECGPQTASDLSERLAAAASETVRIVVDLRGVPDLDLATGRVLLVGACAIRERGGRLVAVAEPATPTAQLLRELSADHDFEVVASLDAAMSRLAGPIEPPRERGPRGDRVRDALAFEAAPEALVALDSAAAALLANRAARALATHVPDDLAAALTEAGELQRLLAAHADPAAGGSAFTLALGADDATTSWFEVRTSSAGPGDALPLAVCSFRDVTAERRREAQLAHDAMHDALTGLPNLRLVREHFELALARARRGEQGVGVLFLDLNGLKRVNDELGHAVGDALLIEFAKRLTGAVRACDPVGRLSDPPSLVGRQGGDEFVVILTDLADEAEAIMLAVCRRLEEALREPFAHGPHEIKIAAAIGGASYPKDGSDAGALLERANASMRQSKRLGA